MYVTRFYPNVNVLVNILYFLFDPFKWTFSIFNVLFRSVKPKPPVLQSTIQPNGARGWE